MFQFSKEKEFKKISFANWTFIGFIRRTYIYHQSQALKNINSKFSDLERAACAFAVLCLVSMGAGLITGACGLFGHHTRILVWASCCSLISGMKTL